MRLHLIVALIACCIAAVLADTEIRNFRLPLPTFNDSPVQNDYTEPPRTPWRRTRVAMSSDEELIGVKLDLDEVHKDWTIRASWAGSSPIKLNMTLVPTRSPNTVILFLQSSQLTPHFPHPLLGPLPLPQLLRPCAKGLQVPAGHYETTIDLALEPLIHGVIPESVIPTIYWIIGAALASAAVVPMFIRFIEAFAAAPLAPNDAGAMSADSASGQTTKAKTKTD